MQSLSLICNKSIALLCDLRSELVLLGHVGQADSTDAACQELHNEESVEDDAVTSFAPSAPSAAKEAKTAAAESKAVAAPFVRVEESAARILHLLGR